MMCKSKRTCTSRSNQWTHCKMYF